MGKNVSLQFENSEFKIAAPKNKKNSGKSWRGEFEMREPRNSRLD
jgi:hypothetical protein